MSTRSNLIPVSQAAKELGVSRQRVMQRLHDGSLEGEKVGSQWLVLRNSLAHGAPSRPLSPRMGWALVCSFSDEQPQWLRPSERARLEERIDRLKSNDPEWSAMLLASWLKPRAQTVALEVHPDDIAELREDDRLVLTGISDPRAGLSSASELEAYISHSHLDKFASDHFLELDGPVERPNVLLRVMQESSWQTFMNACSQAGSASWTAPLAMSIADLVDRGGARERRAALELMGGLWRR